MSEPCPTCGGTGEVRGQECPTCDGTGTVRRTKTLEVNIPAGIDTGKRVRMAGQGGPGLNGGPAGDVNLLITVRPDRRFTREGDDLRTDVDVPVTTAVLGGEVEVTTPTGRVALRIPAETQSGRSFRMRGQGMPKLRAEAANVVTCWPGRASSPRPISPTANASCTKNCAIAPSGGHELMAHKNPAGVIQVSVPGFDHR